MSSARTQLSYLSTTPSTAPSQPRTKLRRDKLDRGGLVLPSTSARHPLSPGLASSTPRPGSASLREPRLLGTAPSLRKPRDDGAVHDSECECPPSSRRADWADVPFRAAKSIHSQQERPLVSALPPDDDGSASSSSASSTSSSSRFPEGAYTYQSTRASSHHFNGSGAASGAPKASAVPTYLSGKSRSSTTEYGSLSVPSSSGVRRSGEQERVSSSSYRSSSSALKQPRQTIPSSHHSNQFTTSSYQPPAAFSSRLGGDSNVLRLPPKPASSLTESTARLSLADRESGEGGGSGYNAYASSRPERLEGTALDAGVHGMKRSWDGFKLEVKFGARRAKKSGQSLPFAAKYPLEFPRAVLELD